MKIEIFFREGLSEKNIKRTIERDDIGKRIISAIDDGGIEVINYKGEVVYTILVEDTENESGTIS